jgi:RNA polymerase sigma factor (sigma-70 family)
MDPSDDPKTSLPLLRELRDWQNVGAWKRFVERYRPLMVGWGLRRNLSQADAEEVADTVLSRLPQALQAFEHDGREHGFRNFLWVAVRHAVIDLKDKRARCPGGHGAGSAAMMQVLNQLEDAATLDELNRDLGDAGAELNAQINAAMAAVRASLTSPKTWLAFELHGLQGHTAQEVAEQLGIPKGDVYTHTSRVRKRLREELSRRLLMGRVLGRPDRPEPGSAGNA